MAISTVSHLARTRSPAKSWESSRRKFIEAGGQTTQSFGLGRIIGQIYALLYLSPNPLCLDEIAAELGVSKASVSTTIRQLESWSAVRPVWVKGDRKDYYEAETDFNMVIKNGLLHVLRKKLNTAGMQISEVEESIQHALAESSGDAGKDLDLIANRFARAKELHQRLHEIVSSPVIEKLL